MARSLRLEFISALYHLTASGNRRETIYLDDTDFVQLSLTLGEVYAWQTDGQILHQFINMRRCKT